MEDTLIKLIQKGTCPFTGQRYDCARCEVYEYAPPMSELESDVIAYWRHRLARKR